MLLNEHKSMPHLGRRDCLINGSRTLTRSAKAHDILRPFVLVFGSHALDPLTPHFKALSLQGPAHECAHVVFLEAKLPFDGFERGSVFPGHLNDSIQVFRRPVFPREIGAVNLNGWFGKRRFIHTHGDVTPASAQCSTLRAIFVA